MTEVNAVFEGGGVKGIALVGALERAEEEALRFRGYAGSSAGAIVAALASVGYHAAEMEQILKDTEYLNFLDGNAVIPLSALEALGEELKGLISEETIKLFKAELAEFWDAKQRKCALVRLWLAWKRFTKKYPSLIEKIEGRLPLVRDVWARLESKYGVYGTDTFLRWIEGYLNAMGEKDPLRHQVTFGTLFKQTRRELKILAADAGARSPFLFSYQNSADIEVARAVQSSMSIPFFFEPFPFSNKFFIDGGTVSNFPAWTFDQDGGDGSPADAAIPVLGFRLIPETYPDQAIGSFTEYSNSVIQTVLAGTDLLQTRRIPKLHLIKIPVPIRIKATTFALSANDSDQLYNRGKQAADRFFLDTQNRALLGLPKSS